MRIYEDMKGRVFRLAPDGRRLPVGTPPGSRHHAGLSGSESGGPVEHYRVFGEVNGSVWLDRLKSEDREKFDRLCQKHFGATWRFAIREHDKVQSFLRDWHGDEALGLRAMTEFQNPWTEFSDLRIDYYRPSAPMPSMMEMFNLKKEQRA